MELGGTDDAADAGHAAVPAELPAAECGQRSRLQQAGRRTAGESRPAGKTPSMLELICQSTDSLRPRRFLLQLRAARYELYDVFFSLSARERMQMIGWDRELAKEREVRRQVIPRFLCMCAVLWWLN